VSCDPERVTGFVDGELPSEQAAELSAHLETCAACRAQADAEQALRARLRRLPVPELPAGLEARVRQARRRPSFASRAVRLALPIAAVLAVAVWLRGYAPLLAWDLARDDHHCFSRQPLRAQVRSGEPREVAAWFERQGTLLPPLPERVGELALVGARYCPLASLGTVAHVYYQSPSGHVSVYAVPRAVRFENRAASETRGVSVLLVRIEGEVIGVVAPSADEARAFEAALRPVRTAGAAEPSQIPAYQE
jgi:anti-sigma factor (TIGR02949 family)